MLFPSRYLLPESPKSFPENSATLTTFRLSCTLSPLLLFSLVALLDFLKARPVD